MTTQISRESRTRIVVAVAFLIVGFVLVGREQTAQHPDVKSSVDTAMVDSDLGMVKVSQDRHMGVLTLIGEVESVEQKAEAESVAAQAAPVYAIFNGIGVRSIAAESQATVESNLDDGTEKNLTRILRG